MIPNLGTMGNEWEMFFMVGWLAIWFLFPIGLFLSAAKLDQDTDQLHHILKLREKPSLQVPRSEIKEVRAKFRFHLPHFRH